MTVRGEIAKLLFYVCRIFPIKKNKIVIDNYAGKGFGDNGKYIALELLKRRKKYDIVWLVRDKAENQFPEGIREVPYASLESIYEQATAKIWIDNLRKPTYVRKRKGQYYIMTWHGGIGPKKIEKEAEDTLQESYIQRAKNDSKMTNLMLAESDYTYCKYRNYFWYDGEIMKFGSPRQDILFHCNNDLKKYIFQKMGIKDDCHIFLYAPTFRNDMTEDDLKIYQLNWERLLETLEEKFKNKWIGFIRLHPNVAKLDQHHNLATNNRVFDVTSYPDMQELLCISDIVLTDYSSCIYDFALTLRPGFILARDFADYKKERDLCFDISQAPFPIATSEEALMKLIKNFNLIDYQKKVHKFYDDFFGLYSGGHAAEITADRIDDVIGGKFHF